MENTPGDPSTGAIGTVSTHLVKDPHRCTCTTPQKGMITGWVKLPFLWGEALHRSHDLCCTLMQHQVI